MSKAYYNEIDPYAAEWLRNLIAAGRIAPGDVDSRSIEDVTPSDLRGYTQCHFFAGIGVWSYALRRAGWPDSEPIWTGSCPCQPFSAAGKGDGFHDERHLWPAWQYLVQERRPRVIVGEQVASRDAEPWLDLVQTDLEALDYAFGALAFPAAGIGAPHIRDRTYFVGHTQCEGLERYCRDVSGSGGRQDPVGSTPQAGAAGALANGDRDGQRALAVGELHHAEHHAESRGGVGGVGNAERIGAGRHTGTSTGAQSGTEVRPVSDDLGSPGAACGVADADGSAYGQGCANDSGRHQGSDAQPRPGSGSDGDARAPGPTNGRWADVDWLFCRDGKWRPVRPGTFPLAHGAAQRVGRLRAYGNAIVAAQAEEFIRAVRAIV